MTVTRMDDFQDEDGLRQDEDGQSWEEDGQPFETSRNALVYN